MYANSGIYGDKEYTKDRTRNELDDYSNMHCKIASMLHGQLAVSDVGMLNYRIR